MERIDTVEEFMRRYASDDSVVDLTELLCSGREDVAEFLVDSGACPDAASWKDGMLPLHRAALSGSAEVVGLLLAQGADPNARSKDGRTALHCAAEAGSAECARALIDCGACPRARDSFGWTPLHDAAHFYNEDVADTLLAAGANPALRDKHGYTATDVAESVVNAEGLRGIAELLHGEPVSSGFVDKLRGHTLPPELESLYAMEAQAADREAEQARSALSTALVQASRDDDARLAAYLLAQGAHPDAKDPNGMSPLLAAAASGSQKTLDLLLCAGSNPNGAGAEGLTPLHAACSNGSAASVGTLLAYGADPSARTKSGYTPLHLAARSGSVELCSTLIRNGAEPGAHSYSGQTPADIALSAGRLGASDYLSERAARFAAPARQSRDVAANAPALAN